MSAIRRRGSCGTARSWSNDDRRLINLAVKSDGRETEATGVGPVAARIPLRMTDLVRRTCALVAIGDELVLGEKIDTNTTWLAQRLFGMGIQPIERVMLGDDEAALAETLHRLAGITDLVICTGGLGPTADDLTREGLAAAMGDELVFDDAVLSSLQQRSTRLGRPLTEARRRMAMRPSRAACLENPAGSAPGLWGQLASTQRAANGGTEVAGVADVVCLPGPPHEMRAVFEGSVSARVAGQAGAAGGGGTEVGVRLVHACGIPESEAAARLGELLERGKDPQIGITVSSAVVTCRVRAVGPGATARVREASAQAVSRLEPFVFGSDDDGLADVVVRSLIARGRKLATAESCTGGMLGEMVTSVAGSSGAYIGGVVTYTDEMKRGLLGVSAGTLEREGAVSQGVVEEMACGALDLLGGKLAGEAGADHAIAVSGVAGPQGGTEAKPVGTVWIAHAWRGEEPGTPGVCARRVLIPGDREQIRRGSCLIGLALVWFWLKGTEPPRLVWET